MRTFDRPAVRSAASRMARLVRLREGRVPSLDRRLARLVAAREDPTVVVVSDGASPGLEPLALPQLSTDVHRLPSEDADLELRLAALGGVDVLVLGDTGPLERAAIAERLVHHLASRGVLVVPDVEGAALEALLHRWSESDTVADPRAYQPAKEKGEKRARERSAVTVERFDSHAEITLRDGHFLKLREEQTNTYLALAGSRAGQVLATREPLRWTSKARLRQAGEAPRPFPVEYAAPELALREYRDVRCYPGQLALQGSVVLADSFRHNQRPRLGNQRLDTVAEPFVVPHQLRDPVSPLSGDFFYLDSSYRGHFGHAMTEQLSRMWAWERAKERFPDLKVLLLEEKRKDLYSFEVELYSAAGVPPDDLVLVPGPVAVERLVAATPMFSQPEYVHPDLREVYRRVSDALSAKRGGDTLPRRFFCSRRHDKRACHNIDDVEQLFADHGFAVVFPEDYSLPDQAAMFREAEVIAGFAGSAMFNLLFCTSPKQVIMLASENYWAQNEYMIASVLGHDLAVAWCRPDVARKPTAGFSNKVFHSPFTFDIEREGQLVLEVLRGLS